MCFQLKCVRQEFDNDKELHMCFQLKCVRQEFDNDILFICVFS